MSGSRARALVLIALVAALVLAAPALAGAMTFRQASHGGTVVIGPNETINDDLYVAGNAVDVRGTVNGTVFAAGNTVSVEGTVSGDVWAAGNSVRVTGDTSGTVHAAGNEVTVGGRTHGDVTLAGNTLVLTSNAVVGRDAALAGNELSVGGHISRDVFAGGTRMTVLGDVGGTVNAGVQRLTLASGATVHGDLRYSSRNVATIEKGATVGGRIIRTVPPQPQAPSPAFGVLFAFFAWIRRLIGLFLFGLIVVLVFPRFTERASDAIRERPLPALGLGFAVLIGVPWAAAIVFFFGLLIGGWWIALVAMALYFIAMLVGTIVVAVFLGRWILGRSRPHPVLALLVGLLVLTIAEAIPILGLLARLAEVVFGLGAIVVALTMARSRPAQAGSAPMHEPAPAQQPPPPAAP
jgi:cytoskeletal protein CcmA (bactofilin family)